MTSAESESADKQRHCESNPGQTTCPVNMPPRQIAWQYSHPSLDSQPSEQSHAQLFASEKSYDDPQTDRMRQRFDYARVERHSGVSQRENRHDHKCGEGV